MAFVAFRAKDAKTLSELASLLHTRGDQVLNGDCKLSLTTQSLCLLYRAFEAERYSGNDDKGTRHRKNLQFDHIHKDVQFLQDFLQKTLFVKVIHRSSTIQGSVQIGYFKSLQRLEIKKVPIHLIEGLQQLRSQLKSITCTRCIPHLQDLLETCGGDMSTAMSWAGLQEACLSYNSLIRLDSSLRLLPSLEALDISHNNLDELDNHLQYLTELVHINLGYNQISVIPPFSLSVRTKLSTLILRNNKLEHLEGVEDLINLQELDVTNNCLSDHSCLDVLSMLDNLAMLCVLGNPLAYHTSHRSLTVQHLSPIAAKLKFILDGKKLTEGEKMLTVRRHVHTSPSRRPTQLVHTLISETERIANHYTFSDSDAIAQSLPISSSPGSRRKTKSKTKVRSRKALIAEFESSTDTTTGVSSQDSSRAPSPLPTKAKVILNSNNKEQFEVMREHYGSDWLRAFNNNPDDGTGLTSSNLPTEDDIYLNDNDTGVGSFVPVPLEEVRMVSDEGSVFDGEKSAEENDNELDKTDSTEPGKLDSEHGIEWKRTDSEQYEHYGLESEPFIVMLGDIDEDQLFLSVNDRYLLEKDVNGELKEMLDLQLLKTMECNMETRSISGIEDGVLLPVVRLTFGYVRKDRRERMYFMEDEGNAEDFQKLLQPRVEAKQLVEKLKQKLHCLKCSADFLKSQAKVRVKNKEQQNGEDTLSGSPAITNSSALYEAYSCPKCGSEMVVEMEVPLTSDAPVGSLPTSLDIRPLNTSSPLKPGGTTGDPTGSNNNSPKVEFTIGSVENKPSFLHITDQKRASLPAIMLSSNSSQLLKSPRLLPVNSGTSLSSMEKVREEGVSSNNTVCDRESEVTASAGGIALRREGKVASSTDFRSRQNSTGSDIAILSNPSDGSVSALTDSGHSQGSHGEEEDKARMNLLAGRTVSPILERSVSCGEAVLSGVNGEVNTDSHVNGQPANPAQSPLSLSVCNSMVSSVYENSISVTPLSSDTLPDQADTSALTDETDGGISIYDSPAKPRQVSADHTGLDSFGNLTSSLNKSSLSTDSSTLTAQPSDASSFLVNSYSASLSDCNGDSLPDKGNSRTAELDLGVSSMSQGSELECDIDFTELDHRLKLHFHMSLVKETEECICMLQCDIVQYMVTEVFQGILLLTSENFYILKVLPDVKRKKESEPKAWLRCIEIQPHSELQHVDMGLGKQSFRLEFDTECSSYSFIVRDRLRCETFVQLITDYLSSHGCDNTVVSMREDDPVTLENLHQQILIDSEQLDGDGALEAGESMQPFNYITGYWTNGTSEEAVSFVVTECDICLIKENHQWPLPRLQAPLSPDIKGSQFTLLHRQKINNIIQIQYCSDDATKVTVCFDDEESGEELEWSVSMVTKSGLQSLVEWIKEPWEAEFGVELEISSASLET